MAERNLYLMLFVGTGLLLVLFSKVLAKSWVSRLAKFGRADAERYEPSYRLLYIGLGIASAAFGIFLKLRA